MASQDWFDKDFYAVLGVSKDVSDQDLKKAYRKLAREYHPDQNPDNANAEQKFKEVSEAYTVLSDAEQRAEYDQIRAMGGGARFTQGSGGAGGFEDVFGGMFNQGGGSRRESYSNEDFEDLLGQMFGGPGAGAPGSYGAGSFGARGGPAGFGAQQPSGPRKGRDQTASTTLSFATAIRGDTVTLQTGEGRSITVRIPAGVENGQKIRLKGKGAPSPNGGQAGDLILQVTVRPHAVFGREGNNLTLDMPVTFVEAATGATIEVPTFDGEPVRVKVPAGSQSGKKLRVKGKGVETKKAVGDLIVTLTIAVPTHLSKGMSEALEAFAKASPDESPRDDVMRRAAQV